MRAAGKALSIQGNTVGSRCQTYDTMAFPGSPRTLPDMIRFLSIRDLAVIDRLELELDAGFTILTGETGAGKSIVVGALGLLRGARASSSLVRTGAERAVVEAMAEDADGGERVLRREVSAQGRSRAFVDDRLVSTATLRSVGARILDIHGQHEHQALLDPSTHVDLLDRYAGLGPLRGSVRGAFDGWQDARQRLEQARASAAAAIERAETAALRLRDIDEVDPLAGEDEALAAQRRLLANAERVHRLAAESYAELYDGDGAVLDVLDRVWRRVEELAGLDAEFAPHLAARDTVRSHLEELAYALRSCAGRGDASPEQLPAIEERLAKLERLKRRHGPTLADVIARRDGLRLELERAGGETDLGSLEAAVSEAGGLYADLAGTLSERRRAAAGELALAIERGLAELAMERTRFEVVLQPAADGEAGWTERGVERAEFYFSANPGEDVRPLARIASGGELSRVMLALRTVVSTDPPGRTLVFDEVDAGVGGEAAERIGARLHGLAERYQVVCITHLPQIAARGTSHHRVTKCVRDGRTQAAVARLDGESRAAEIARMMTGTRVSGNVLESARELLSPAGPAKRTRKAPRARGARVR